MLKYEQKLIEAPAPPRLACRFSLEADGVEKRESVFELDARAAADFVLLLKLKLGDAAITGEPITVQVGRDVLTLEAKIAVFVAQAVTQGRLRLEELEQANRIAFDGAILAHVGAPFGFSNDPRIKDEVKKLAAWDPQIRRYLGAAGNIKSKEVFGTPSIVVGAPPKVAAPDEVSALPNAATSKGVH